MKQLLIGIILLGSIASQAGIEEKVFNGKTADGSVCTLEGKGTSFVNSMPHPLNERVKVVVTAPGLAATEFDVQHPAVIDAKSATAFFNHDEFQGVNPTKVGASALVIVMEHSEVGEGPTSFTFIDHAWKANKKTSIECTLQ